MASALTLINASPVGGLTKAAEPVDRSLGRMTRENGQTAFRVVGKASPAERAARGRLRGLFEDCPIPQEELLANLGLFVNRQSMGRMLFLHELYRRIVPVEGVVMELGVRWGQTLALFSSFRGLYEPFNYTRRIVGFDTFEGFPSVSVHDRPSDATGVGAYGVTEGYDDYLRAVLECHEQESPIGHITKYDVVRGDVVETVPRYLEEHPETIVALAFFDVDLYEPTRACLEAIRPYLTRGSVIAFDELNCPDFPGETLALREVLGLDNVRLERSPLVSYPAFAVID
jgi:hypothetical protein